MADKLVYNGDLADGLPHGHGTQTESMGMLSWTYTGEWERGARHGYGVMVDSLTGEKYLGMWVDGVRQGRGCVVNLDGVYYEGNFVANKLTGPGVMIFDDGSIYRGEFCSAGKFSGKGVFTTKSNRFEGEFHGNYSDGIKFNGTVYNITEPSTPIVHDSIVQSYTVKASDKWGSVFAKFTALVENHSPWEQMAIAINNNKALLNQQEILNIRSLDYLERIPDISQSCDLNWNTYNEIVQYLTAASSCSVHPFHHVLQQLIDSFNISYGGDQSHPTLLLHAKDELQYISDTLYNLLRRLFPMLPPADKQVCVTNPANDNESMPVTSKSLLLPLLLPSIHSTLFHLYVLKEKKVDDEYFERVRHWNRYSDAALLAFFDIDSTMLSLSDDWQSSNNNKALFVDAATALQKLKTTFTPAEKMDAVVDMFEPIRRRTRNASTDLLVPICVIVVVRAKLLQLGAELVMLFDILDEGVLTGQKGFMLTTLHAAYTYILNERVIIN